MGLHGLLQGYIYLFTMRYTDIHNVSETRSGTGPDTETNTIYRTKSEPPHPLHLMMDQAGYSSGNALDLYLGDTGFESLTGRSI
jgi:hypothetical protein